MRKYQNKVVGGQLGDFDEIQIHAFGKRAYVGDVPHAPFGIVVPQAGVERRIAGRGVLAVALEGTVEKQSAIDLQKAGSKWARGKLNIKNFPVGGKITGWGEDQAGVLYYLINSEAGPGPYGSTTGSVYKIIKN